MDLHRERQQIIECLVSLLRFLQTCLDCVAQRLDLVREVPLDSPIVLLRGIVLVTNEQLDDVVYARAHGGAALVDLVEVDKGLV